jgi:phenylalanyl-tRNA synthetase alpha chain
MDERTRKQLAEQVRFLQEWDLTDRRREWKESGLAGHMRELQDSGLVERMRELQESGLSDRMRELQESGIVQQLQQAQDLRNEIHRMQELSDRARLASEALRLSDELARNLRFAGEVAQIAPSLPRLEQLRVGNLGRSSASAEMKKTFGQLPAEIRPEVGEKINRASRDLEEAISVRAKELAAIEREARLRVEAVDVTLPGVPFPRGHLHPSMRVIDDVVDFFVGLGYRVAEGPEVETDYYNFTALNIPPGHPARGMQATFFLDEGMVLRTHTSPVQIRTMLAHKPPVYVVCPGRVYRRDSDPTHTPMFNQIEGLAVDRDLTLAHLKGTLTAMARHVFGDTVRLRLRPSYFQFTEPSVEMDVSCFVCDGEEPACKVSKGAGWLEMGGAGMVDPAVLEEVGYDPEEYSGFAFGFGPDRMAMTKYGVPDLRLFFEGDLRFLQQF